MQDSQQQQLQKGLTTAIEQLAKTSDLLEEQVQKYRAANEVLVQLLERNEILQLSILNTKQAAALLCTTPRTIRDWHQKGLLQGFRYHDSNKSALYFRLNAVLVFQQQQLAAC
ncbi:MAG: MerR family transcriptional regulator [Aureispira sp.]